MIGLKRGTVELLPHDTAWDKEGERTVNELKALLGGAAADIQHIGSTSVPTLCAKPIIDIAVAAVSFDAVLEKKQLLSDMGYRFIRKEEDLKQLLFACGDYYTGGENQTHFIHVVQNCSVQWHEYVTFRDYLRTFPDMAAKYENVKKELILKYPSDRNAYTEGKADFISHTLKRADAFSYLYKNVRVIIDRKKGSAHPKHKSIIYGVDYGYIPDTDGGDGEETDVYILDTNGDDEADCRIVAFIHRHDDDEDKLVGVAGKGEYGKEKIKELTAFVEKYFKSEIFM